MHQACHDLVAAGFPVPPARHTPGGDTLAQTQDGIWSVAPWIDGQTMPASTWTPSQVEAVGQLLGRIHQHLATHLPPPPDSLPATVIEPQEALQRFDRYRHAAQIAQAQPGSDTFDGFDELTVVVLRERGHLLTQYAAHRPAPAQVSPAGWCHGDFHDLNLLWQSHLGNDHDANSSDISAVLDWDRLSVRPVASEVVRTAALCFQAGGELDLERVSAFVSAYRTVTGMSVQSLADAAKRVWWERICDVWQLKYHYDKDNPSCDHLFRSASTLIPWWSHHCAAVTKALSGE